MTSGYEFLIRAYTEESIPRRAADPFALTDVVGHLLSLTGGDGDNANTAELSSFLFSPGDAGAYWKAQPNFRSIDAGVGYIALSGGGRTLQNLDGATSQSSRDSLSSGKMTKGGPGFFYIKPTERPLNSQVGTVAGNATNGIPTGATEYDTCVWEAGADFLTYLPDNSQHTRLALLVQAPNQTRIARTKKVFEANRQLRFDLAFFGKDFGGERGAFRLHWGDDAFALVWREGSSPEIERMGEDGEWHNWHTLEGAPKTNFAGEWKVYVCRLNGALVIRLEGGEYSGQWDFADAVKGESEGDRRLVDIEWPRGRVSARAYNALFSLGIAILDHAAVDKKTGKRKPFQYQVVRDAPRPYSGTTPQGTTVLLPGNTGGWKRNSTQATVLLQTLEPSQDTLGVPVVRWTCTMTASPDGIDSPCVAFVFANYEGALIDPAPEFIDVRSAALKGSFTSSQPPESVGSELRLDLSRNMLQDIRPDWEAYIHEYHPIELAIRRQFSDGTFGPWVGRFKGYQLDPSKQNPGPNEFRMSLVCESTARRLQKPHAYIDHKYYPMDLLYFRQGGRRLFVSQCVQEIIRIEMGAAEAARFNGNGDPLRFLEDDHPPLIATNGDYMGLFPLSQPLVKNGFTFAPLWKQGPLDWIKKLMGYDRTVFFYAFLPEDDDQSPESPFIQWPYPICGRYEPLVAARQTHRLADAVYNAGDEDSPLSSLESRIRTDYLYNHFVSTSTPEGATHPLLPDLLTAQEQLPASDRNSAAHSWRRSLLIEEDWLYKAGVLGHPLAGLAASAFLAKREFADKDPRTPTLVFRGFPQVDWGDKVHPARIILPSGPQRSDPDVMPGDTDFRVLSVRETYNFETSGVGQYMTTAEVAPLSTDGF